MTSKVYGYADSEEVTSEFGSWSHERKQCDRESFSTEDTWGRTDNYEDESSLSSFIGSDHCSTYEEISAGSQNNLSRELTHEEIKYANLPISRFKQPQDLYSRQKPTYTIRKKRPFVSFSSSQQKINDEVLGSSICDGYCHSRSSPWDKCVMKCWNRRLLGSAAEAVAGKLLDNEITETISANEKHKIETFFRGLGTDLFVSSSMANLYIGWKNADGKWLFKHTGIPLVVLDRGDTKSRNKKRIQIMLAERGTCFPLWKDIIDNLTSYEKAGEAFHTMHLSSNHRQIIGLSFDSSEESDHFYNRISELTSDPENINIYVPGSKKNKKHLNKKFVPLPHKEQISNPCLFEHVTSIAAKDKSLYISLKTLLGGEFIKKRENIS